MKFKVDVQQVCIYTAAIFGIGLPWINLNEKVFKTSHLCADHLARRRRGKNLLFYTMSDSKLVKMSMDAATLTSIAAGIGWIANKMVKETLAEDPSSNVMNYATAVMAGSVALKQYLEDQKVLSTNSKISLLIYHFFAEEMASIAMMIRSAVLNTTVFYWRQLRVSRKTFVRRR